VTLISVNQRFGIAEMIENAAAELEKPGNRITTMNLIEKSKTLYSGGKAFVSRHPLSSLVVMLIILQPMVWLAMRSMENTLLF
jgi:hypothetical protein